MADRVFVFPGQGSQAVGMGRDLAGASTVARLVFEEVDDALSQGLSRLMFDGPGEELVLTENAQPALMAVSLAVLRTLEDAGLDLAAAARFVAGHSLGEYSALCAAGAFSLADTARLLKARGRAATARWRPCSAPAWSKRKRRRPRRWTTKCAPSPTTTPPARS